VVVDLVEHGYQLLLTAAPPLTKEMANAQSALDQSDIVSTVVAEMVAANVVTLLSLSEKPLVVNPLGVVPKPRID
jgi:hypothetical protein